MMLPAIPKLNKPLNEFNCFSTFDSSGLELEELGSGADSPSPFSLAYVYSSSRLVDLRGFRLVKLKNSGCVLYKFAKLFSSINCLKRVWFEALFLI